MLSRYWYVANNNARTLKITDHFRDVGGGGGTDFAELLLAISKT